MIDNQEVTVNQSESESESESNREREREREIPPHPPPASLQTGCRRMDMHYASVYFFQLFSMNSLVNYFT